MVKAKAVAAIALGLRFAHSFGLIHGSLTASNILFDADHCIQIADFGLFGFEGRQGGKHRRSEVL
jgi:serine/threonine protein kinase